MSGEFEKPVVPKEKLPRQPKVPELTPEDLKERDATLEQITIIIANPALDDPDDAVFFQALIPMLELGRTDAYKNHYRAMIAEPAWHTFTDKYGDRIEAVTPQIKEWGEARLKQKWAEQKQAERA